MRTFLPRNAVTAAAIAKAAGAGKQTLYRWWPSKGRIVLEAFLAKERERIDRPREAAMAAGDLRRFLLAECAGAEPFDAALRFLVAEAQGDADLIRSTGRRWEEWWEFRGFGD